jgi:excisionase family DNA binding protein
MTAAVVSAPSPYLTAAEAMTYLRLGSRSALQRLIVEHRLPCCRRGRLYLFDTRELDAWLHGHASALDGARAAARLKGLGR